MCGKAICDKLSGCIFENFETARLKRGQFQIFKNHEGDLFRRLSEANI